MSLFYSWFKQTTLDYQTSSECTGHINYRNIGINAREQLQSLELAY